VSDKEEGSRNSKTESGVQPDSCPFTRWCFGTRTMRAKRNPPSCIANPLVASSDNASFSEVG
jgi:hypothetical protein